MDRTVVAQFSSHQPSVFGAMLDQPFTADLGQKFFETSLVGDGHTAEQAHRCE
ncbi:MAG: hypothetical protein OXC27_07945 [Caldilineaceae bacterium]|nr:hypothetical protein [Caldilineaceae bacterium]